MTTSERIQIIKQYPLFHKVPDEQLISLAENAQEESFPKGVAFMNQYQPPPNGVYFVYKGLIRIYILSSQGKMIPVRIRGAPYLSGEMNIFNQERTATVETLQPTDTLKFMNKDIINLIMNNSDFALELIKLMVEKVRAANKQTEIYFTASLKDRLLSILKDLASHFPNNEVDFSQEELADIVGATRARVTESLHELHNEKLLVLSHHHVRVL